MKKLTALLLSGLMFSSTVWAQDVSVQDAYAYATSNGRSSANVYFHITSKHGGKIVSASSPAAEKVVFETMDHSGGKMTILTVDEVELPRNQTLDMTSEHRHHLKLIDLKQPLKVGDSIAVSLDVVAEQQPPQTLEIEVNVKP